MNILILNPPFLKNFSRPQRSPAVTKSGTLYYPLWLSFTAGVLEEAGHNVAFFDAPADDYSLDDIISKIEDAPPKLIVLDTSTPSIDNDVKVCDQLKTKFIDSFIILVGTHVSALPQEVLSKSRNIDAIACMEYEYTIKELAEVLEKNGDLSTIKGIVYRNCCDVFTNPPREFITDLDMLPFVSKTYKKYLNIRKYFNPNALFPMVTIIASRGCPFQCIFCVYPQTMMGRKPRFRSAKNVVDEMEYIKNNFPDVKSIFFEDDTLTSVKKYCTELCEEIIKRNLQISWTANSRADVDLETLKLMKKSGCHMLCVGFESGNQKILENMKKSMTLEKMHKFVKDAKEAEILVHGCFMVGLPGETQETMQQTLDLSKALNPDTAQFYPIMVYPGTEAYNWYKDNGLLLTDNFSEWLTADGLHNSVIRTGDLTGHELVEFCDRARKEFYLRPQYILRKLKQMILHPEDIGRTLKSAKTFFKYLFRGSFSK